jgi:Flp pilus assembly protein TadG
LSALSAAVVRRGIDPQSLGSEQGQTLVEFALVLPILLLLVIGIFDFGTALNQKNELNFLANTAARYAEVNSCAPCNGQTIETYVKGTAVGLKPSDISITFTLPQGTCKVGDALKVTASENFSWLGGVTLPGIPTGDYTLASAVTVRILQASDGTLYTTSPSCP